MLKTTITVSFVIFPFMKRRKVVSAEDSLIQHGSSPDKVNKPQKRQCQIILMFLSIIYQQEVNFKVVLGFACYSQEHELFLLYRNALILQLFNFSKLSLSEVYRHFNLTSCLMRKSITPEISGRTASLSNSLTT